jgi:hypothetical protein
MLEDYYDLCEENIILHGFGYDSRLFALMVSHKLNFDIGLRPI